MLEQIHGHEVMEMMITEGQSFTRETLKTAIAEKFGEDARFYTCSKKDMNISQLIEFLHEHNKFVNTENGFNTSTDKMCSH